MTSKLTPRLHDEVRRLQDHGSPDLGIEVLVLAVPDQQCAPAIPVADKGFKTDCSWTAETSKVLPSEFLRVAAKPGA